MNIELTYEQIEEIIGKYCCELFVECPSEMYRIVTSILETYDFSIIDIPSHVKLTDLVKRYEEAQRAKPIDKFAIVDINLVFYCEDKKCGRANIYVDGVYYAKSDKYENAQDAIKWAESFIEANMA